MYPRRHRAGSITIGGGGAPPPPQDPQLTAADYQKVMDEMISQFDAGADRAQFLIALNALRASYGFPPIADSGDIRQWLDAIMPLVAKGTESAREGTFETTVLYFEFPREAVVYTPGTSAVVVKPDTIKPPPATLDPQSLEAFDRAATVGTVWLVLLIVGGLAAIGLIGWAVVRARQARR